MRRYQQTCIIAVLGLLAGLLIFDTPSIADAHDWQAPKEAAHITNPVAKDNDSIQRGKKNYRKYCLMCHGPFAKGNGLAAQSLDPKPANLVDRLKRHSDGDFYWKVMNGRLSMPGFNGQMTNLQVWDTINFVKSLEK